MIIGIPSSNPRDSIPPLDDPEFEAVTAAGEWLDGREPGALFRIGDDVRFFPLRILTFHEVVNLKVGGRPAVVTFCPLCNTAVVFDPTVDGEELRFGVSGLLRFSDLVMWDSKTDTLWQHVTGEGIVGDLAGTQLELLPSSIISWEDFQRSFSDGKVLSRQTGFSRSYGQNPYVGYSSSTRPFLCDGEIDQRFPAPERVVGVTIGEADKAFPFRVIVGARVVNDKIGGAPIAVFWGADTADALDSSNISEGQAIGTGIAFDRRVNGQVLTFVANGDDTFTDEQTGSTWDLLGRAVDGPLVGEQLGPVVHATTSGSPGRRSTRTTRSTPARPNNQPDRGRLQPGARCNDGCGAGRGRQRAPRRTRRSPLRAGPGFPLEALFDLAHNRNSDPPLTVP